ncbi:MAG: SDR family NAD(P)-dependent oxidoreductase [Gammaproteobacteria bacterium]|nr:SDR family NAD(P)-dependent oxidoreductase [Gammaproteobacteria bacterium]
MVEGKVAVVTGSGRGIGREIALLMAKQGARVVVNDLGASLTGEGQDVSPAAEVVAEIEAAGGQAVVNGDNVADRAGAQRMVEQAVDTFGRVDCIVNNAGILRDRIFHRMNEEEFDAVVAVHLKGAWNVSRAAAPFFKEQQGGSYIHFTSTSGLIGNFGQTNYGAAKLGVMGLSRNIALDMARFNVTSNCIAPFAWSRLIGTIPSETEAEKLRLERIKSMGAEKIAPLPVYLASDQAADVTGQVFVVRKNEIFLMSQPRPIRSAHNSDGWTPETIAERVIPSFQSAFTPLERSADVFCWDPI